VRRAVYAFIAITILAVIGGFPAYMAMGQGGGGSPAVTITVSAKPVVSSPPGGEGGGGGGGGEEGGCPVGQASAAGNITAEGLVIKPIVVKSFDGRFRLIIDAGTVALTRYGSRLTCIGINKMGSPSPPEGAYVIGVTYDVAPKGATLSPPATLECSYSQNDLPQGVGEKTLVIAYYDEASGEWIKLDSVVNTETNTITAKISRLNDLAVFGYGVEAPPPAAFQISSLGISPTEIEIGEAVDITILVANTGGQSGSYQVILKINGVAETAQEVILDAGASKRVSFTTSKEAAGSYSVDVNGVTGAFEVKQKPAPPFVPTPAKPISWWLISAIIAAAALAALLTYLFLMQRKYSGVTGILSVEVGKAISLAPKLAPKVAAAARSLLSKFNKLIKKG